VSDSPAAIALRPTAREGRAHLASIIESSNASIIGLTIEGTLTSWNPGAEKVFGYNTSEVIGQPIQILFPREQSRELAGILEQVASGRRVRHFETVGARKDGRAIDLSATISPLINSHGVAIGACAIVRDISESRQAASSLSARADQQHVLAVLGRRALAGAELSEILDEAVVMVADALEVDFCRVLESKGHEGLLFRAGVGWKEDLVGNELVSAELDSQAGITIDSGDVSIVRDLRTDIRFAGSKMLWEHAVISGMSVVIPGRNQPWGVLGAHTLKHREFSQQEIDFLHTIAHVIGEVIEQKAAAERLESKEALLQMAGQMSHVGGWAVDLPDLEVTFSDEVCAILERPSGFSPSVEESLGFYAPEFVAVTSEALGACMKFGIPFDLEAQLITTTGRPVWIRSIGEARRDEHGSIRRVEGAFQDISDRKRIEQELLRNAGRLAAVAEIQQILATSEESIERLFERIAEMAQAVLDANGAVLEMIDGQELVCRASSGLAAAQNGLRRPINAGLAGRAILQNRTLRCEDTESDPRVDRAVCRHFGVRSMTVALLKTENGPIGTLRLIASQPNSFSNADCSSLEMLANSLSAVIQRRLNAEKLRTSEAQYRLLFAGMPQPMFVVDPTTLQFLAGNDAAIKHYGYSREELLRMTIRDLRAEQAMPLFERQALHQVQMEIGGMRTVATRHRTKEGAILDVEVTFDDIEFHSRRSLLAMVNDVTERMRMEREAARANRALQILSRCNEALIRAEDETLLLENVCRLSVEIGGFPLAWVGYAMDDDEKRIVPQAHAGNESGYLATLDLTWAVEEGHAQAPAGRAVTSGRPVFVPDFATEPPFPWREEVRRRGFTGVICLPLSDSLRTFGVLVLYLSEVRELPADELRLLEELAQDLAFGIVTLRARVEQRRTLAAVLAMAQGVSASTGSEFFEKLTSSLVETLGAHAGFISQITPDEPTASRTLSAIVDGRVVSSSDYGPADLPCEQADGGGLWIVSRDAWRLYPQYRSLTSMTIESCASIQLLDRGGQAIGTMSVLFHQPMAQREFTTSTLQIFGSRAAAELERQKADDQVRQQAALIDDAPNGIFVHDLTGRIVFWNQGAERLYGWPSAYAVGQRSEELFRLAPEGLEASELLMLDSGVWSGEVVKATSSGSLVTVDSRVKLLREHDGRPRSVLVIDTDITERKKLEQQFLRAQRMESIGTLAGGIAHDLNNVLMPIIMGATLLKRLGADEKSMKAIVNIEQSARRGSELVKQVLSFARGVQGSRISVDPNQVLHEVRAIAETTFPRNIRVETEVAANIRFIVGDLTQINQILLNLCVNARDAMPTGGSLTISASNIDLDGKFTAMQGVVAAGPYIVFQVSDTGIGMTRETVERIFEPFFTTKDLGSATGLGLSTSLGIVRSHGGLVNVYSEPGRGSVFTVYLPAQAEGATGGGARAEPESVHHGNGELILVVDDEVSILSITKQALESFGYRVITARDGEEALRLYADRRSKIALVLTDMMMPIMEGPALIAALVGIDPAVRIIATSGLNSNADPAPASRSVRHFLQKPYSAEVLLNTIHRVLKA
jgi:PAS domain S-box-containing protein